VSVLKGVLKGALFVVVPLLLLLAFLKWMYVDIVTVGHNGMAPTLLAGDHVLVWRGASPDHGDVVLCRHPEDPTRFVMARIVGLPGTSISIERGALVVDGDSPMRDRRGAIRFEDPTRDSRRELQLGIETLGNDVHWVFDDERRPLRIRSIEELDGLYLLGDHHGYTGEDSREFGTVLPTECVGQVFMRLSPGPSSVEGVPHGWLELLGA
jgi:signal peptidase I